MARFLRLASLVVGALAAAGLPRAVSATIEPVATYSILGHDPDTGEIGGAVQSRVFSVGNGVLWAEAGVGIVTTQAIVDVSYGPRGLELLAQGLTPAAVVKALWESDPDPRPDDWSKQGRQFAVMDRLGRYEAFTGPKASAWAGHRGGRSCTAQGNILAGEGVVNAMVDAFETTAGHLSFRLLAALDAGQAAGGDTRGMQSAAMLIVKEDGGVWLNNDVVLRLQVDDSPAPLAELRRLVELAAKQRERVRRTRTLMDALAEFKGSSEARVGRTSRPLKASRRPRRRGWRSTRYVHDNLVRPDYLLTPGHQELTEAELAL